ncbi:MAG: RibD family protein [Pseudomonadota bacterium]
MQNVDVTDRIWSHILDIRAGRACSCCGDWTDGEQAALDLYGPLARRDIGPMTVGQIGQSLDGRIATVAGDARDISGPDGLCHLHRMRALVDAVVIGVRTALHDKPRLSVRLCGGDSPARVVIDPRGRLPDDSPVFRADGSRRIVVQAVSCSRPPGVEVLRLLKTPEGRLDPKAILTELNRAGLNTVLIEGGGITIGHFLEAGLLSRLQVAVSPLLIGGGPAGLNTRNPVTRLADAIRPDTRVFALGSDVLFDCALSPTARDAAQPQHADPLNPALQS